jgi:hypothetical protein
MGEDAVVYDHCIIAVIGPEGCGKRTLTGRVTELFNARREQVRILPILIAAVPGAKPLDPRFFKRVSDTEFDGLTRADALVDRVEHMGQRYGYSRIMLSRMLEDGHVIAPMRSTSAARLRELGFPVHVVRIIAQYPSGNRVHRTDDDAFQRSFALRADLTIVNEFSTKGLSLSVNHLAYLVTMWTGLQYSENEIPNAM